MTKVSVSERAAKAIPHPTFDGAYYLSLTWLGIPGGICGDSKFWDAADLTVICKETGFNHCWICFYSLNCSYVQDF